MAAGPFTSLEEVDSSGVRRLYMPMDAGAKRLAAFQRLGTSGNETGYLPDFASESGFSPIVAGTAEQQLANKDRGFTVKTGRYNYEAGAHSNFQITRYPSLDEKLEDWQMNLRDALVPEDSGNNAQRGYSPWNYAERSALNVLGQGLLYIPRLVTNGDMVPNGITATNRAMFAAKEYVQSKIVQMGSYGLRRNDLLGDAIYVAGGFAYAIDEVVQPKNIGEAAAFVAAPGVGKVVGSFAGVAVEGLVAKAPWLAADLGQVSNKVMRSLAEYVAPRSLASVHGFSKTGVTKFDQLFVNTPQFEKMSLGLQRRGIDLLDDSSLLSLTERAQIRKIDGKLTIVYNRKTSTLVDILHESRHGMQIQKAEASGLLGTRSVFKTDYVPLWERGAYEYELRLGERVGFSEAYKAELHSAMKFEGYYMKYESQLFNSSSTKFSLMKLIEPTLERYYK